MPFLPLTGWKARASKLQTKPYRQFGYIVNCSQPLLRRRPASIPGCRDSLTDAISLKIDAGTPTARFYVPGKKKLTN